MPEAGRDDPADDCPADDGPSNGSPPNGSAAGRPGGALVAGVRLAVTTLTVVPVRAGRVDRPAAAVAMSLAPVLGVVLGAALGGVLLALAIAGLPATVAAALTVSVSVLVTRGLHLDGLADTVDALGSYRARDAALKIMKRPDIGPFGVAAVVLTLLVQVAALGALPGRGWQQALATVVAATAAGRLAVAASCRRGVPAARSEGLGALVAGTVPVPALLCGTGAVALVAVWAVPARPWQGPLAVVVALAGALLLVRHAVRRFGGITGDVIGAAVETTTTVAYVLLLLGSRR